MALQLETFNSKKSNKMEEFTDGGMGTTTDLQKHLANKPKFNYASYDSQLDDVMDRILNREKFSYNMDADALYQQYKDKYIKQGQMAMQDTMGQAAAMTGGYGNSYAVSAGNQAYQQSLDNLNDVIPELYQLAYDKYRQEGDDLLHEYSLIKDRKDEAYSSYENELSQWQDKYNELYTDEYNAAVARSAGDEEAVNTYDIGALDEWVREDIDDALSRATTNAEVGDVLDRYISMGLITVDQANYFTSKYWHDEFEDTFKVKSTTTNEAGETVNVYETLDDIDYGDMLEENRLKYWTSEYDGGNNGGGENTLDRDAKVKAPDGEVWKIADLYRYLKNTESMSAADAKKLLIALQNHLGIGG